MSTVLSETIELIDIQGSADRRGIAIDLAGINGMRLPLLVEDVDGRSTSTVVDVSASVQLGASQRGAHMSRFVQEFENLDGRLSVATLPYLYRRLRDRCSAIGGRLTVEFPWFLAKRAPITGVRSSLDIAVRYSIDEHDECGPVFVQTLHVPVTTLCPCSKAISSYGAHNQRTSVMVDLEVSQPIAIERAVVQIESCASCEIYGALKRLDERYVTEKAYENPKFVEDVARDVYLALKSANGLDSVRVRVESLESIHNHQAFALIDDFESSASHL